MTAADITREQAEADLGQFFGEGWTVIAVPPDGTEEAGEEFYVSAWKGCIGLHKFAPSFRAAVDALRSAWSAATKPAHDESAPMRECRACGRTDACVVIEGDPFCRNCAPDVRDQYEREAADCADSDNRSYNYSRGV